ncbi:MAG: tRNA (adenosine(37)-N6)-threonylcarbamoyltransferase complex dimerization subunit type 1 TsaB [Tepidisphaeraceae bacterium]
MIRALALETSGRTGSVALSVDGGVVAEETFSHGLQHAATLLPMIDRLTQQQGWRPADIGRIHVSIGPGSFTGLRVGVTLAKTLAFATGATITAVPSANVLLANAPADAREVVIVLDAKRGQIFTARFTRLSPGAAWTEAEAAHLDTLAAMLAKAGRPVHLIGEGIPYHRDAWQAAGDGVVITDESLWRARAAAVAELGHTMAERGEFADAYELIPLYVRIPEAEEKRLAAEAGGTL